MMCDVQLALSPSLGFYLGLSLGSPLADSVTLLDSMLIGSCEDVITPYRFLRTTHV